MESIRGVLQRKLSTDFGNGLNGFLGADYSPRPQCPSNGYMGRLLRATSCYGAIVHTVVRVFEHFTPLPHRMQSPARMMGSCMTGHGGYCNGVTGHGGHCNGVARHGGHGNGVAGEAGGVRMGCLIDLWPPPADSPYNHLHTCHLDICHLTANCAKR